jgi:hypothetical protein
MGSNKGIACSTACWAGCSMWCTLNIISGMLHLPALVLVEVPAMFG